MYLSRLILNPRNRLVQREIANPYNLHRRVMHAFPDHLAKGEERVLFRLDTHPRTGMLYLLVQSLDTPDWQWLDAPDMRGYLLPIPENPSSKPFDPVFSPGQMLAFRLRANPTRRLCHGHQSVGKDKRDKDNVRVPIYKEEEQIAWLKAKGAKGGFEIAQVSIRPDGQAELFRGQGQAKITRLAGTFDGILRVTDPELFTQTLAQGVGTAKGLGFGLLSLAPPRV